MANNFHLFLPGFKVAPIGNQTLPLLTLFFQKAQCDRVSVGREYRLNTLLGLQASFDFPYAALAAHAHHLPTDSQNWMHAAPVALQVGPQGVFLVQYSDLNLTAEEGKLIQEALQPLFEEDDINFTIAGETGFLNLPSLPDLSTNSIFDVVMKDLTKRLPSGNDANKWRRIMTEAQMVLQTLPFNRHRLENRLPVINSVWFWGQGTLPASFQSLYPHLYSDASFVAGLAKLGNGVFHQHAWDVPLTVQPGGCLISNAFMRLSQPHQFEHQALFYQQFEQNCLAPLLNALKAGEIKSVTIEMGEGQLFTLKSRYLNYFWRRKQYAPHTDD